MQNIDDFGFKIYCLPSCDNICVCVPLLDSRIILNMDKMKIYRGLKYAYIFYMHAKMKDDDDVDVENEIQNKN